MKVQLELLQSPWHQLQWKLKILKGYISWTSGIWMEVLHTCPDVWYWSEVLWCPSWPIWVTLRSMSQTLKKIMSNIFVKIFQVKQNSGELHCPVTAHSFSSDKVSEWKIFQLKQFRAIWLAKVNFNVMKWAKYFLLKYEHVFLCLYYRSPTESKKRHEEKQAKAQELRDKLMQEKSDRLREIGKKVRISKIII